MKRLIIYLIISKLFVTVAFSQNGVHKTGRFTKTIEFNLEDNWTGGYNLNNKDKYEILLFGRINSLVEYYFVPTFLHLESRGGFRLLRDSVDQKKYFFEIKHFVGNKIYSRNVSISDVFARKFYDKMVSVIDNFKAIYEMLPIDEDGNRIDPNMEMEQFLDGHTVTFRAVVEYELWTLKVHAPNGIAGKMDELCISILKNAKNNEFDETYYEKLLDSF